MSHRATRASIRRETAEPHLSFDQGEIFFWVSAEKAKCFLAIYPDAQFEEQLPPVAGEAPSTDDALKAMVTGWLGHTGPTTASALASFLRVSAADVERTLLRIESSGLILRGHFTGKPAPETQAPISTAGLPVNLEWCERRLLARIHRLTLGSLRKQIEPVTAATFHALAFPLAACCARHSSSRRARHNGNRKAIAGL